MFQALTPESRILWETKGVMTTPVKLMACDWDRHRPNLQEWRSMIPAWDKCYPIMVATCHMWLFKVNFKLVKIQQNEPFSSSVTWAMCPTNTGASGYHTDQHKHRTFPPSQNLPSESIAREGKEPKRRALEAQTLRGFPEQVACELELKAGRKSRGKEGWGRTGKHSRGRNGLWCEGPVWLECREGMECLRAESPRGCLPGF